MSTIPSSLSPTGQRPIACPALTFQERQRVAVSSWRRVVIERVSFAGPLRDITPGTHEREPEYRSPQARHSQPSRNGLPGGDEAKRPGLSWRGKHRQHE
jgi:hypothetical protein